ncbi:MAG: ROK family protein [Gemmatimonadales bacterium]|nr:ROK family protein [Gemmatimonadales bacterium]MDZ4390272.1 ROK family protein [Gemmatimonadales bacterium]
MNDSSGTPAAESVLVVDIGGTRLKMLVTGETERRVVESGPEMTATQAVQAIRDLAEGWHYDAMVIGYPGPVADNIPTGNPRNLGPGWQGFDFAAAFPCPVTVVNDALLQAIGSYDGGRMLFMGLGTGLGTALVIDDLAHPLELAHLPYRKGRTFEEYLGVEGLERMGEEKWRRRVDDVVQRFRAALLVDYVVIGGGNVKKLEELPEGARRGGNDRAFLGGFRLAAPGGIHLCSSRDTGCA